MVGTRLLSRQGIYFSRGGSNGERSRAGDAYLRRLGGQRWQQPAWQQPASSPKCVLRGSLLFLTVIRRSLVQ